MRTSDPADWEDFEAALEAAEQGLLVSDTGLSDEVQDAMDAIRAIAPNRDPKLVQAARDAFERQIAS